MFEGSFEHPNPSFQLQPDALLYPILLLLGLKLTELAAHGSLKIVVRSRVVFSSTEKSLVFMEALEGVPSTLLLLSQPFLILVVLCCQLSSTLDYRLVQPRSYPIRLSWVNFFFFFILNDGLSCEFLLFDVVFHLTL